MSVYDRLNSIPDSEREQIRDYIRNVDGKYKPSSFYFKFLFEMFNKYIGPLDDRCGKCRKRVKDYWKYRVIEWYGKL